jgi:hypothetical protein
MELAAVQLAVTPERLCSMELAALHLAVTPERPGSMELVMTLSKSISEYQTMVKKVDSTEFLTEEFKYELLRVIIGGK